MNTCSFKPYEGTKPYIFVSYAHKDSEQVYPILNELAARGYRIWYDDGITPGSEWPENIAQHLNNCTVTMAFISVNSLNSDYCRREITFGLSKKKTFLTVMLEDIELPLGMELQLSAQQCVMGYLFTGAEELAQKICLCPDLEPCLEAKAMPISMEPAAPVVASVPQVHEQKGPEAPAAKKSSAAKPTGLWIGLGAASVVAIGILLAVLLWPKTAGLPSNDGTTASSTPADVTITILPGVTVDLDATELTLSDAQITADVMAQLNKLPALKHLDFVNCEFTTELTLDSTALGTLQFENCTGTQYLQGLNKLTGLYTLTVSGSRLTDEDVPALRLPALNTLRLKDSPFFTDLSKLEGCAELRWLNIDGTGVEDLTPLTMLLKLYSVSANGCPITSIDCLASKTNLLELSFNNCQIKSVSEPFKSLKITTLSFHDNPLEDISGFAELSKLTKVDFGNTKISSFKCIENSAQTLLQADLSDCGSSAVYAIENCVNLKELCIDNTFVFDMDHFAGMTKLEVLSAAGCDIYLTDGLNACTQLKELYLTNNSIDDLSFLKNLAPDSRVTIDLSLNYVKDLSDLPDNVYYLGLSLLENPIDFSTAGAPKGSDLLLTYNESLNAQNLPNGLEFYNIIIIDCPDDQKLGLQQIFPNSITFMTLEEFLT